jgi:hypothetical protein
MNHDLTPKQRVSRILRGERPDCIPAAPAYLVLFLADFERAYYIELYRRQIGDLASYAIDHEEDTRFRAEAFYQSYGIFKTRPDWMELHRGASRTWANRVNIVNVDGVLHYEDKENGLRVPMRDVPLPRGESRLIANSRAKTDLWDTAATIQSKEHVDERLPIPTADELLDRGDFDLPMRIVADYGDRFFLTSILDTPFSNAYDLLGFQGLMTFQYDQRELFHYLLDRQLAKTKVVMEAWARAGVHGIYVEEVFTGADLISPRAYDEFVYAYNRPYFEYMSGLGLFPIHYVCGDVIPRLDRIAQLDIAAVAVEESKKSFTIEIAEVVERVNGRLTVLGNIDAVKFGPGATMAEMTTEVRRQARIGARAKGFLVSTGSPFPLDTNPRLIDVMVETAHSVTP